MDKSINRKNRDRRGGHKGTYIADSVGQIFETPKQRALMKRIGKKQLRRDHAKAIAEGMSQYNKDVERPRKPWEMTWEEQEEQLDWESKHNYEEFLNGYEDDDAGHYDTYGDDYDDYDYYHGHDDDHDDDIESRRSGYMRMSDYVIQRHQVGMTLQEVMSNFLEYR